MNNINSHDSLFLLGVMNNNLMKHASHKIVVRRLTEPLFI